MQIMPVRNKLVYPAGMAPGFDPAHVAAINCRFSATPIANTFFDMIASQVGFTNPLITANINGYIGPNFTSGGSNAHIEFFGGRPAVTDAAGTCAAIFMTDAGPSEFSWFSAGSFLGLGSNATYFALASGGMLVQAGSNFNVLGSFSVNTPYFAAASLNSSAINWVIKNLRTGQVTSGTTSGFALVACDGSYVVGIRGNSIDANLAASMYSATLLSLSQLRAWAEDPWAFWYPRSHMIGDQQLATPAASFVPSYTASAQQLVIGGGTGGVGVN